MTFWALIISCVGNLWTSVLKTSLFALPKFLIDDAARRWSCSAAPERNALSADCEER